MTVETQSIRVAYIGDGSKDTYEYPIPFRKPEELIVLKKNNSTKEFTVLDFVVDFTVNNDQITLTAGNLEPGFSIIIYQKRPRTQNTNLSNKSGGYPQHTENALDDIIFILQQEAEKVDRALSLPNTLTPSEFDPILPSEIEGNANTVLMTNETGTGFKLGPKASEVANAESLAAQAATSAADAASSLAAIGSSVTDSQNSANTAATHASNAATSASAASSSESNASTSETNAATSESNAASSASASATSASNAAGSATTAEAAKTAAESASTTAATHASNATASASAAATSASNAATSAAASETAKIAAEAARDAAVAGGGGSGEGINFILNSNFKENLDNTTLYNDSAAIPVDGSGGTNSLLAISRTIVSSELLGEVASLKLSKSAGNAEGEGSSSDIKITPRYKNTLLPISFNYKTTADYKNGDIKVYAYDVDNSLLIGLIENDQDGDLLYHNGDGTTFTGYFKTTDSLNYKLLLHVATTNVDAYDVIIDDLKLAPSEKIPTSITKEQIYTISQAQDSMSSTGGQVRFNLGTATVENEGESIIEVIDDASNSRTIFQALRDCTVVVSGSGTINTAGYEVTFYKNGILLPTHGGSTYTAVRQSQGSVSISLKAGEYFSFGVEGDSLNSAVSNVASLNFKATTTYNATISTTEFLNKNAIVEARGNANQTMTANSTDVPFVTSRDDLNLWDGSGYTAPADIFLSYSGSIALNVNSNFVIYSYINGAQNESHGVTGTSISARNFNGKVFLKKHQRLSFRINSSDQLTNNGASHFLKIVTSGATAESVIKIPEKFAYIKHYVSSGPNGGAFTSGDWRTKPLNLLEGDTDFISLSSNQFTLQAGIYYIDIDSPANKVNRNQARLYNITDSTTAIYGSNEYMTNSGGTSKQNKSNIKGKLILNSAKTFEVQHRCETSNATDGFGVGNAWGDGVFTQGTIKKVN